MCICRKKTGQLPAFCRAMPQTELSMTLGGNLCPCYVPSSLKNRVWFVNWL